MGRWPIKFETTKFVSHLRDMDISGDFVVAGSFALAMNGIIHPAFPPRDLDILVNDEAWARDFRNLVDVRRGVDTGDLIRTYAFPDEDGELLVEASRRWVIAGMSRKQIFNSHRINGMKAFSLASCKNTMEYLDRPKDRDRLKLLESLKI